MSMEEEGGGGGSVLRTEGYIGLMSQADIGIEKGFFVIVIR